VAARRGGGLPGFSRLLRLRTLTVSTRDGGRPLLDGRVQSTSRAAGAKLS
jgi:hypothetical protein